MSSQDPRVGEAITALTARLNAWAVDDAHAKATDYVNDMLHQGWRPRAPKAWTEEPGLAAHNRAADPKPYVEQVRAALHANKATATTEEDS